MRFPERNVITLSPIALLFIVLIAALGWIVVFDLLRDLFINGGQEGIIKSAVEIGREVVTVVAIAAAAAIATERYLKTIVSAEGTLETVGIKAIFERRLAARNEFLGLVRDDNVRNITICGISLRDFLPGGGSLNEVWREICDRLQREQAMVRPDAMRLHVRLLVLLPRSDEGYFRHKVESRGHDADEGLPSDVQIAVNTVRNTLRDVYNSNETQFLQLRSKYPPAKPGALG